MRHRNPAVARSPDSAVVPADIAAHPTPADRRPDPRPRSAGRRSAEAGCRAAPQVPNPKPVARSTVRRAPIPRMADCSTARPVRRPTTARCSLIRPVRRRMTAGRPPADSRTIQQAPTAASVRRAARRARRSAATTHPPGAVARYTAHSKVQPHQHLSTTKATHPSPASMPRTHSVTTRTRRAPGCRRPVSDPVACSSRPPRVVRSPPLRPAPPRPSAISGRTASGLSVMRTTTVEL